MKIVLLSAASSIHTIRWANGLSAAGINVHVISQHPELEPMHENVKVHILPFKGALGYFTIVPAVKKLLNKIQPDLVNAHYASGYGTTAFLANYHPFVLSVWGDDVYDVPYQSLLHKFLVKNNIRAADKVASTSHCMAVQTRIIVPDIKDIAITPFGVDIFKFKNIYPVSIESKHKLIIGTVKSMSEQYGIDILIEAFNILYNRLKKTNLDVANKLHLRLVGGGPRIDEYKALVSTLNLDELVTFVGHVPHENVPAELEKLDIYVALSRNESFGVAIIEAGAAARPVVVSDAGGLPEVTIQGKTGLIVPRENPQLAAEAIEKLVLNPTLRREMGIAGRKHVDTNYPWSVCIEKMIDLYTQVINDYRNK